MFNLSEVLIAKFDAPRTFLRLRTDESTHNETGEAGYGAEDLTIPVAKIDNVNDF